MLGPLLVWWPATLATLFVNPAAESAVSWYPGYEAPFGSGGTFDEFIHIFCRF